MGTIVISYNEKSRCAIVYDTENALHNSFDWNENFEIEKETPDTDCQDFNDNSRWLMKTLLAILKMEKEDDMAHCDWSADYNKDKETGKYTFEVKITKRS